MNSYMSETFTFSAVNPNGETKTIIVMFGFLCKIKPPDSVFTPKIPNYDPRRVNGVEEGRRRQGPRKKMAGGGRVPGKPRKN